MSNPTLEFPVPLVNQPFVINTWLATIMVTCTCKPTSQPFLLVGPIGAIARCPTCQREFQFQAVQMMPDGNVGFRLAYKSSTSNLVTQ